MRTLNYSRLLRTLVLTAAVGVSAAVFAATSHASDANTLMFSRDVALPGVVLPAGSYVFEIANPTSSSDVVRVRRNGHVQYQGITLRVQRPARMPADQPVTLGEARPETASPILAWFPIGSGSGHQFVYR